MIGTYLHGSLLPKNPTVADWLLARAAEDVDAGRLDHGRGMVEADRIRGTVAQLCTEVMDVVGQATGPGPLTGSAAHARAVADLQVYLRQHHGHRDDARLGGALDRKSVV